MPDKRGKQFVIRRYIGPNRKSFSLRISNSIAFIFEKITGSFIPLFDYFRHLYHDATMKRLLYVCLIGFGILYPFGYFSELYRGKLSGDEIIIMPLQYFSWAIPVWLMLGNRNLSMQQKDAALIILTLLNALFWWLVFD